MIIFVFILLVWMFLPTLLSFRAVNVIDRWSERQAERDNQLSGVLASIASDLAKSSKGSPDKALVKAIESQTAKLDEIATAIKERPTSAPAAKKIEIAESTKDKVKTFKAQHPTATQRCFGI